MPGQEKPVGPWINRQGSKDCNGSYSTVKLICQLQFVGLVALTLRAKRQAVCKSEALDGLKVRQ
jgi:hypothetical protein